MASATTHHARGEIPALQLLIVLLLALRLYFDLAADPVGDEAYYWMWGQRLGWSYFDHPPLHAWLMHFVAVVAGWSPFSIRLLTWFTLAAVTWVFWRWSQRLDADAPRPYFWRLLAIYLASPLFFALTGVAYHDHLVVALSLVAVHLFVTFIDRHETGQPSSLPWLYAAAVTLGLAVLGKYNGVFVGVGFACAFLWRPTLRRLLATPHPWLAALLSIAMQAPVFYWNMSEGLASYRFHLDDRWGDAAGQFNLVAPLVFILLTVLFFSPFLLWPLAKMLISRPSGEFEDRIRSVVLPIFLASTATFLLASAFLGAYPYWNIVALAVIMPLLAAELRSVWLRWLHLLYGLGVAALAVTLFAVAPLPIGNLKMDAIAINFGWDTVARRVSALAEAHPADLIGATRYSTTSQLGFALRSADVVKLSPEHSQYDYWQDTAALAGRSALILVDERDDSPRLRWLAEHFATLSEVDSFSVERFGTPVYHWRVLRGEGFRP